MDIQKRKNENFKNRSYSSGVEKENRIRIVRKTFSKFSKGRILDVGCADGEILRPFVSKLEIHGLDFTENFVDQALAAGIQAKICDFSKDRFPFIDAFFDVVFTGETIEHLIDTDLFLSEINRVLKNESLLILTVPNVRTPVSLLMMTFLGLPPQFSARYRSPHYRDFTLKTIQMALVNNGFELVKSQGASIYVPGLGETLGFLARFFPSWSSQMVLVAKKVREVSYNPDHTINFALYD